MEQIKPNNTVSPEIKSPQKDFTKSPVIPAKIGYGIQQDKFEIDKQTKKLKEEYIDRKLGLIASCYDKVKSLTGYGKDSKKALKKLQDFNQGKATKEETEKYLKDYKYSQKDATEIVTDLISGGAAFSVYATIKKLGIIAKAFPLGAKMGKAGGGLGVAAAIIVGALSKPILKRINVIGVDKKSRKKERSIIKDFLTGAVDGALAPVALFKNMVVGIPLVLGANSATRYVSLKKDKKSFNDFCDQQLKDIGLKAVMALAFIAIAAKGHLSIKEWEVALNKSLENIKKAKALNVVGRPSEFKELVNQIGLMSEKGKICQILSDKSLTTTEARMRALEKENIFIPKYLQTIPDNVMEMGLGKFFTGLNLDQAAEKELGKIITGFKSECPVSRTVKEAQQLIGKTYGDKYIIQGNNALGTGTVAETYLAKEKGTGREVVIKLLKDGMSADKIEKDRKVIMEMLEKSNVNDSNKLAYYKKRVDVLFDAWKKEVDLQLESDAAELLAKNARQYNVVKPIEVKDNIYVMEKAAGIQFNKFTDYLETSGRKLTQKEYASLMINYLRVYFEQLLSVPKKGMKVMHADPHPGNVFIDIDNLTKPLTFIDTGNVLRYTPEEAITNTMNSLDYLIGNSKGVAQSMLRGATLPEGMSEQKAIDLLTKELNEKIYNKQQKLPPDIDKTVNNFCLDVMDKYHIISNPNNTNLLKAKDSYKSNILSIKDLPKYVDSSAASEADILEVRKEAKLMLKEIGTAIGNSVLNNKRHTLSELRSRYKYVSDNKEQFLSTILDLCGAPQ